MSVFSITICRGNGNTVTGIIFSYPFLVYNNKLVRIGVIYSESVCGVIPDKYSRVVHIGVAWVVIGNIQLIKKSSAHIFTII